MIKDKHLPTEIFHTLKLSNDIMKTRLGDGNVKNVSYELYKKLNSDAKLNDLPLHNEKIHQQCARNALIDNLVNDFDWHYWLVITFGYYPQKYVVEDTLESCHYRFDRWLMTNNKLDYLSVAERSKWICLPEKGREGHLHYNCFLNIPLRPNVKTYGNEWNGIRVALNQTFRSIEKQTDCPAINFKLYERRKNKNALKTAVYSTKEMTTKWTAENNNEDHFASFIRSWADWHISPMSKRSPLKIKPKVRPEITLEKFYQ